MEEWIRNNFEITKPFPYEDEEYVVVDKKTSLFLPMFLNYCKELTTPLTVDKLKSVDEDDKRGWFHAFDTWKKQGIID